MKKKDPKIIIGSPAQGALSYMGFTESAFELGKAFQKRLWKSEMVSLWNEYYVPRARNYFAHVFLQDPDATHLLFIDVDEIFRADQIVEMVKLSMANEEYHVMCGTGPMKIMEWKRIHQMALDGQPFPMLKHASSPACTFRTLPGITGSTGKPFEVRGGGTGIMLIKRECLEGMASHMDTQRIPAPSMTGTVDAAEFFTNTKEDEYQPDPENSSNELITEDLVFCDRARKHGFKVWVDPNVTFQHIGMHVYEGCLGCSNGVYIHEMVKQGE